MPLRPTAQSENHFMETLRGRYLFSSAKNCTVNQQMIFTAVIKYSICKLVFSVINYLPKYGNPFLSNSGSSVLPQVSGCVLLSGGQRSENTHHIFANI